MTPSKRDLERRPEPNGFQGLVRGTAAGAAIGTGLAALHHYNSPQKTSGGLFKKKESLLGKRLLNGAISGGIMGATPGAAYMGGYEGAKALQKKASKLDKLVSIGMNVFSQPAREVIARQVQTPLLQKAILDGKELSPILIKLFRKELL